MISNIRGETIQPGSYTYLGPLKDAAKITNGVARSPLWTGAVSVKKPVKPDILKPESLNKYYVTADLTARMRCIDGRCVAGYGTADAPVDRPLGMQVPGGTPTAALCYRFAALDSLFDDDAATLARDTETMSDIFARIKFKSGGHIDDMHQAGKTGCGAIDKIPEILSRITLPEAQEQVRRLAQLLVGDRYDRNIVDALMGRLLSLEGRAKLYFSYDPKTKQYQYNQKAIAALKKKNPAGIATLIGQHKEVGLVVNTVSGTTFHPDQFATDQGAQLFNYDFWSTIEAAHKMYPNDSLLQKRYILSRVLFAIGTAMVLTDGTPNLIVRRG
jgi:hypothetical protein